MKSFLYFLLFACLFMGACEDPIQLGAGLVDSEVNDPEYTDTIVLLAKTVEGDPPITFRNSATFSNSRYLLGSIEDPIFGTYSSETYFDTYLTTSFPDLRDAIIDSVMLVITLDSTAQYGNEEEVHTIDVFQLTEKIEVEAGDTLQSDLKLDYDNISLGGVTKKISHRDSLTVFNPSSDTLIKIASQLRIPMDTTFWSPVARDSSINKDNDALADYLRGFALVSSNAQNSMIGLLFNGSSARFDFYYTVADTAKRVFSAFNGLIKHSYFEHDYAGSEVESAIGDPASQEFLYLHSMAGVNLEFDLQPLMALGDSVVINSSEIELTIVEPDPLYPPVNRLLASYYNDDGQLFVIEDIVLSSDFRYFDGSLDQTNIGGITYDQYSMHITSHLNNLLEGSITDSLLIVSPFSTQEQANRSVIYGPKSSVQPAQLKLIITKP